MVENSKTVTLVNFQPPRGMFTKTHAPTLLSKMEWSSKKSSSSGSSPFPYVIYFLSFILVGRCYSYSNLFNQQNALFYSLPSDSLRFCLKESYPSTRLVSEVPLRVFDCTAYVHNVGPNQIKCVYVGYPLHQRGYKCFYLQSKKCFVTMDVTFCEDRPYFPVGHLQGESLGEESNNTFEFIEPTPSIVFDINPHPIVLPTNQVPWKTYYRRNLKKEVGSSISQSPAPVQDSEPPQD